MRLSFAVLCKNASAYIEPLLQAARSFADEIVVGVDASTTDATSAIVRRYADKLFLLEPFSTSERALRWLNDQCTGDWILRLDHDELPSTTLVAALPHLMRDREVTHYWLPRRWVIGPQRTQWIAQDPWWPDWQLRLFRNIRSLVQIPGTLHSDYLVLGAGRYFCEGTIYHFDLVYHTEEQRWAKVLQYDRISPGASRPSYYFPDAAAITTRPVPANDPPWQPGRRGIRRLNGRRMAAMLTDVLPAKHTQAPMRYVSLTDLDKAEWKAGDVRPALYQAALECVDCPPTMMARHRCPVELRLRNESPFVWPGPGLGEPQIRVSYHWRRATGGLYAYEGMRTDLPGTLRPDETISLIAHVLAPTEPGAFVLQWDLVIEYVSWFADRGWQGPAVAVQVLPVPAVDHAERIERELYVRRWGEVGEYLWHAHQVPGWIRSEEAAALARVCQLLPDDAVIVEIGTFLGSSSIIMAGARKRRGSGIVHCIDPFDGSGDAFSVPIYQHLLGSVDGGAMRARFEEHLRHAGVDDWVQVHQGTAAEIAETWATSIDLLFLDGDHSRVGARDAYERWVPFLKPGGLIAVHNTEDREYAEDHDGNRLLALAEIVPPEYTEIRLVGATTFARKVMDPPL